MNPLLVKSESRADSSELAARLLSITILQTLRLDSGWRFVNSDGVPLQGKLIGLLVGRASHGNLYLRREFPTGTTHKLQYSAFDAGLGATSLSVSSDVVRTLVPGRVYCGPGVSKLEISNFAGVIGFQIVSVVGPSPGETITLIAFGAGQLTTRIAVKAYGILVGGNLPRPGGSTALFGRCSPTI